MAGFWRRSQLYYTYVYTGDCFPSYVSVTSDLV